MLLLRAPGRSHHTWSGALQPKESVVRILPWQQFWKVQVPGLLCTIKLSHECQRAFVHIICIYKYVSYEQSYLRNDTNPEVQKHRFH